VEAEVKREQPLEVTLVRGGGGIFEVWNGDDLIYTKARTGRFPQPGEINRLLK
jgi:predicted Rdx family selenoprotein